MRALKFNRKFLKDTLKQRKITYAEFADILNENGIKISENTIKPWFNKTEATPDIDKIVKIARILDLDINDLVDQNIFDTGTGVKAIPIVGEASCGLPILNSYQDDEVVYISENDYKKGLYAVIASGDSMAPEINDRDILICDPDTRLLNGDLVHYQLYGESAVKIYYYDENLEVLKLIPINQAPYFQTKNILKSDTAFNEIKLSKVVNINKDVTNNRSRRLKEIKMGAE